MGIYDEAQHLYGVAKHASDQLDSEEVRAFASRVMMFLDELNETMDDARIEIPGSRLLHQVNGMFN